MRTLMATTLMLLTACTGDSAFAPEDFETGLFNMTTTGVDDGCADGAFDVIFLPDGVSNGWDEPTELPSFADLPVTYDLTVPAPYNSVTVTAEDGGGQITFTAESQTAIDVDVDTYPDCVSDVDAGGAFTIVDADNVQGSITLTTSNYAGADCPVIDTDPCDLTLDLSGARQ